MKNHDKTYKSKEINEIKKAHNKKSKKSEMTNEEYYKKWEDDRL